MTDESDAALQWECGDYGFDVRRWMFGVRRFVTQRRSKHPTLNIQHRTSNAEGALKSPNLFGRREKLLGSAGCQPAPSGSLPDGKRDQHNTFFATCLRQAA